MGRCDRLQIHRTSSSRRGTVRRVASQIRSSSSAAPCPSTSQVKKAGQILRRYGRGEPTSADAYEGALTVVRAFRAAHSAPLVSANNGLRSMVRTVGCPVEVTQRLKRMNTILDKLNREPTLPLSSMQDIGGVRAVVPTIAQIRRVEARLRKNRPVSGYSDYISNPRQSGYRGVHIIVQYGGRQIEVQLRTPTMHAWALMVERVSSTFGENLKQDGDGRVQLLMAAISEAMAAEERGEEVPIDTLNRIRHLSGNEPRT